MALDITAHELALREDSEAEMTPEEYAEWEAECVKECRQRLDEYRAGRMESYSLEEVIARMRERLNAR
jgi:hypothetical protein